MLRAVVAAVLAFVAFASAADAAPIELRHDRDATAIALAGADVVVLSERGRGRMVVVALPRTGGPARTLLSIRDAGLSYEENRLAASGDRVAVIVESEGTKTRSDEHRVYSGPPSEPLRVVRRTPDPHGDAWTPYVVSVDGDRLLLVEGIPTSSADDDTEPVDAGPVRVQILDRSGWTPVPWASSKRVPLAIAGPYAVVAAYEPRRIELVDVASGSPLSTLRGAPSAIDLASDGRVAFTARGQVQLAALGQPQRSLGMLGSPRIAGSSIAGFNGERNTLDLLGADGSRRPLGPPSLIRTDVEADEHGVVWLFNGCVRYAPLDGAVRTARGTRCPTSEVALYGIAGSSKLRGRTARVPVRCVTAAAGRCRGRLVVRLDYGTPVVARGRFDIPAGDRWVNVPVRFDRRTVARFHREDGGSALVNAKLRDGTVGSGGDYSAEFGVEVDDRS